MEIKRTIAISIDNDEFEILQEAQYLVEEIARNVMAYRAEGVVCSAGTTNEVHVNEDTLWKIASMIESLQEVRLMYSNSWDIKEE